MPPVATLIGDVVGSRASVDRDQLHTGLTAALTALNVEVAPVTPLRITIGDEYQGCFRSVGAALDAALRLSLALAPHVDVRHGIGFGPVRVLEEEPRVEDGPGWWAAREAVDAVHTASRRPGLRRLRTEYRLAPEVDGPTPGALNAALMCRDQVVGSLSDRSRTLLRGLLAGRSQVELADELGISASAASQRVRRDGLAVVVAAQEWIREV